MLELMTIAELLYRHKGIPHPNMHTEVLLLRDE